MAKFIEFEVIYKGDDPDMSELGIPGLDDDNFKLDKAFIDLDEITSVHKTKRKEKEALCDPCLTMKNGDSFTLTISYEEIKSIILNRQKELQRTFI